MSDQSSPDNPTPPDGENLGDEFLNLGKNLSDFMRAAWKSPEGQHLKHEVRTGMKELGSALNNAVSELSQGETGQQLKKDFEDLRQRVSNGEVENRSRLEILTVLRKVNDELSQAAERWKAGNPKDPQA